MPVVPLVLVAVAAVFVLHQVRLGVGEWRMPHLSSQLRNGRHFERPALR